MKKKREYIKEIKKNWITFDEIPYELVDEDLYYEYIRGYIGDLNAEHSNALWYEMPDKRFADNIYLNTVKKCGQSIRFMPKDLMNRKSCMDAIMNDGVSISYVPIEIIDQEICNIVCTKITPEYEKYYDEYYAGYDNYKIVKSIPKRFFNIDICKEIIKRDSHLIENIPKKYKSLIKTH